MPDHPIRRVDLRIPVPTLEPDDAFLARLGSLAAAGGAPQRPATHQATWRVGLAAASVAAVLVGIAWLSGLGPAGDPDPAPSPIPATTPASPDAGPATAEPSPSARPDAASTTGAAGVQPSGGPVDPPAEQPDGQAVHAGPKKQGQGRPGDVGDGVRNGKGKGPDEHAGDHPNEHASQQSSHAHPHAGGSPGSGGGGGHRR